MWNKYFFHRVLAEPEFPRDLAIGESVRNQGHDLLLARRE